MFVRIEKVKVKGKGEVRVDFFVNSFSDYVILPPEIVEKIKPKILREVEEIDTPGGPRKGPLFLVTLEVEDPETKERRSAEVEALMLEKEPPVIGIRALSDLGIQIDFKRRKYRLV